MTIENYINTYQTHKENFEKFFGQNTAELYWKIWKLHNIDKISYDKLAYQYAYAKSSIKNIIDRVEYFLDNPILNDITEEDISDLTIMYPNEFICGTSRLSLNAHKIWFETICRYQNQKKLEIPRNHLLSYSSQYKNVSKRTELLDEFRTLKIRINENKTIQAFSQIEDNQGTIAFQFTEECLDYIDPLRRLFKHLAILNN